MTNTALTTLPTNAVELNKIFGFEGRGKPALPTLKVNGSDEEEGCGAPKGTFVFDDGERLLYASDITIRTFIKGLQYRVWNAKDKNKNDMSIIANSFRAEFRSISGKIACGKLPKKQYLELGDNVTSLQKELQDSVKCKLIVFGLVSGTFKSVDTDEEVVLKDELFIWTTSQSSFMIMEQTISGIEKERRAVPCTPIKLKLKKEKSGSVTYFTPQPEVLNETVSLDPVVDIANLNVIKKYITDTNDFVSRKYNEALKGKAVDDDFKSVGEILEGNTPNDPLGF